MVDETNLILVAVPLGPAHAESWRSIWRRLDCWAPVTLRNKLGDLALAGLIQRREQRTATGFRWLYWRASTAPAREAAAA